MIIGLILIGGRKDKRYMIRLIAVLTVIMLLAVSSSALAVRTPLQVQKDKVVKLQKQVRSLKAQVNQNVAAMTIDDAWVLVGRLFSKFRNIERDYDGGVEYDGNESYTTIDEYTSETYMFSRYFSP